MLILCNTNIFKTFLLGPDIEKMAGKKNKNETRLFFKGLSNIRRNVIKAPNLFSSTCHIVKINQ